MTLVLLCSKSPTSDGELPSRRVTPRCCRIEAQDSVDGPEMWWATITARLMRYKCLQSRTPTMPIDLRKHDPDDPITIRPKTNKAKFIKLLDTIRISDSHPLNSKTNWTCRAEPSPGRSPACTMRDASGKRATASTTASSTARISDGSPRASSHSTPCCLGTRKPGSTRMTWSKPGRARELKFRATTDKNARHRARNQRRTKGSRLTTRTNTDSLTNRG